MGFIFLDYVFLFCLPLCTEEYNTYTTVLYIQYCVPLKCNCYFRPRKENLRCKKKKNSQKKGYQNDKEMKKKKTTEYKHKFKFSAYIYSITRFHKKNK